MGNAGSVCRKVTRYDTLQPFYIYRGKARWLTKDSTVNFQGTQLNLQNFHDKGKLELSTTNQRGDTTWNFRIYPAGVKLIQYEDGQVVVRDYIYTPRYSQPVSPFYYQVLIHLDDTMLLDKDHVVVESTKNEFASEFT